jgi:hypothetical protein
MAELMIEAGHDLGFDVPENGIYICKIEGVETEDKGDNDILYRVKFKIMDGENPQCVNMVFQLFFSLYPSGTMYARTVKSLHSVMSYAGIVPHAPVALSFYSDPTTQAKVISLAGQGDKSLTLKLEQSRSKDGENVFMRIAKVYPTADYAGLVANAKPTIKPSEVSPTVPPSKKGWEGVD